MTVDHDIEKDERALRLPGDAPSPEASSPQVEMTLLDHLEELRWVVFKSVVAFVAGCSLVVFFITRFADLLRWPYEFAIAGYEDVVAMHGLINTSFLGVFSVIFQLMFIGGIGMALPIVLYFFGGFIAPGLTPAERRILRPGCVAAFLLFLGGGLFSFFILLPLGLRASVVFNDMLGFTLLITASSYYSLLTWAVLGVGLVFQFPLILVLLIFMGVLETAQLRAFRRYSIIFFLLVSAILTPADPITLFVLAIPMCLLYEGAILVGVRIERWKAKRDAELDF
ncbi:MAG: twin-arginine translocase subunit TatC [Opitutales bacterium]|nr:twin-arginine translocase subunit TatC [Opitutales bacterium]